MMGGGGGGGEAVEEVTDIQNKNKKEKKNQNSLKVIWLQQKRWNGKETIWTEIFIKGVCMLDTQIIHICFIS